MDKTSADLSAPIRPFRCWMTGSFAGITAATLRGSQGSAQGGSEWRVLRHSRYGVGETVQRIVAAARLQGLSVLAVLPGPGQLLVLASSVGGTVMVMDRADSAPEMPLSMLVRAGADGGCDVWVVVLAENRAQRLWDELPRAAADDVHALPQVVEYALQ